MILFDPGLQPERTALAWRRTGASLAVGSLIALRILPAQHTGAALAAALLSLALALVVLVVGECRYRRVSARLRAGHRHPAGGGGAVLLTVVATLLLGALGLVAAIV